MHAAADEMFKFQVRDIRRTNTTEGKINDFTENSPYRGSNVFVYCSNVTD